MFWGGVLLLNNHIFRYMKKLIFFAFAVLGPILSFGQVTRTQYILDVDATIYTNGTHKVTAVADNALRKELAQSVLFIGDSATSYVTPYHLATALTFTSPLVKTGTVVTINNSAADGSTKGAASFTAADFNATSGNISIDYTNGQAAATGTKGFLTSTDWNTFNGKESALTFTSPLTRSTNTVTLSNVTVPFGGSGNTTFTAYSVLCAGTTSTGAFQNVSGVGTSGQVLQSQGAGALPQWATIASVLVGKSPISVSSGTISITDPIPIVNGGTNATLANTGFNNLAPSQTSNSGKFLTTNGTNTSWGTLTAGWGTSGNALTGGSPSTPNEFFGSTNVYDVIFKANNTERMRLDYQGSFLLGSTTSYGGYKSVIQGAGGLAITSLMYNTDQNSFASMQIRGGSGSTFINHYGDTYTPTVLLYNQPDADALIGGGSGGLFISNISSAPIIFTVGAASQTEAARIFSNGHFNINQGNSTARLSVTGEGSTTGTVAFGVLNSSNQIGLYIDDGLRVYGSAIHNNANAVTGTTNQYIASGTYTATLTNTTNIAASTAYQAQWIRVGNVVTVSGKVDIDVTLVASTASELQMTLPIASNLTAEENLGGSASSDALASIIARIKADATSDKASFVFKAISATNDSYAFSFTYLIQ